MHGEIECGLALKRNQFSAYGKIYKTQETDQEPKGETLATRPQKWGSYKKEQC